MNFRALPRINERRFIVLLVARFDFVQTNRDVHVHRLHKSIVTFLNVAVAFILRLVMRSDQPVVRTGTAQF